MTSPVTAAKAYSSLARIADPAAGLSKTVGENSSGGQSFASMVKDAIGSVVEAGRKSDAQQQAMLSGSGKTNIVDVVTAVAETEVAVEALVSVRDRVIHAYDEIMKMPI
jgi:flagellar hook-basal body complex protein FliE